MNSSAPPTYNPMHTATVNDEIPRYVQFTSPVSTAPRNDNGTGAALPLNIVALIVSYLDEAADLANVTRTCRLLYYMTLPSLYTKVTLRSYPEIRYVGGRPEGFGSGSPFLMALNGLIASSHAGMVKELRLRGEWKDPGVEEFAKGRVPDNTVLLNTVIRAALGRMSQIQTFHWQLDCKPLKTLYQGLQTCGTLTSFTLKFPSTKDPRPSVIIPPIPSLRKFHATDIDPLCYPDDISMLVFGSKKLEDLRLHFSPRMRREAECSLNLNTYFGRCLRAGYQIPLKHMAIQNFYGPSLEGMHLISRLDTLKSMTAFDMFGGPGGSHGGTRNVYLDSTWSHIPPDLKSRFRTVRSNEKAPQQVQLLSNAEVGLESFYLVNAKCSVLHNDTSPGASVPTPPGNAPPSEEDAALGKQYLHTLTRNHGASLKKMLLSDQWLLTQDELADLVRHCSGLEELGIAIAPGQQSVMRVLIPFLPKLTAFRLLAHETLNEALGREPNEQRMEGMGRDLWKMGITQLKWIGVGELIYRVGEVYSAPLTDGAVEWRREVIPATFEDVKNINIWRLDSLDLDVDPVMPFDP